MWKDRFFYGRSFNSQRFHRIKPGGFNSRENSKNRSDHDIRKDKVAEANTPKSDLQLRDEILFFSQPISASVGGKACT